MSILVCFREEEEEEDTVKEEDESVEEPKPATGESLETSIAAFIIFSVLLVLLLFVEGLNM